MRGGVFDKNVEIRSFSLQACLGIVQREISLHGVRLAALGLIKRAQILIHEVALAILRARKDRGFRANVCAKGATKQKLVEALAILFIQCGCENKALTIELQILSARMEALDIRVHHVARGKRAGGNDRGNLRIGGTDADEALFKAGNEACRADHKIGFRRGKIRAAGEILAITILGKNITRIIEADNASVLDHVIRIGNARGKLFILHEQRGDLALQILLRWLIHRNDHRDLPEILFRDRYVLRKILI